MCTINVKKTNFSALAYKLKPAIWCPPAPTPILSPVPALILAFTASSVMGNKIDQQYSLSEDSIVY